MISEKSASLSDFIPFFETFRIFLAALRFNSFSMTFIVRLFPNMRQVQNGIDFPPSLRFMPSMNTAFSLAELEPSTGVPKIRGSKVSIVEGNVSEISMMGSLPRPRWLGLNVWCCLSMKNRLRTDPWFE